MMSTAEQPSLGIHTTPIVEENTAKERHLQLAKQKYATKLKKALKLSENAMFEKAVRNFTSAAIIFTLLQYRKKKMEAEGNERTFTKKEKNMALALYKQGPKAYRWLRKILVLPAPVTLSRKISRAPLKLATSVNLFQELKIQAKHMRYSEKLCILLFDEITIKPQYNNRCTDTLTGFVKKSVSTKNKIADHAVVFMLRGVQKNYKQPLCYTLCSGSKAKEELPMLIKTIVKKLKSIGFNVIATVCDQSASNVYAINHLVDETKRRYNNFNKYVFEVDGEEIVPIFDPPHLIKGIRNNLLGKNLQYTMDKIQKTAKWEHIKKLYQKNLAYNGIKLMPKLTKNHVNPKKLSKMKTKCATQVFSRTVGVKMGYFSNIGILPEDYRETADILLFFDNLFDSVNGSRDNMKERSEKPLLGPLTPKSVHRRVWTDSKPILKSMTYITKNGKSGKVPTITNWIRTIENFEYLKSKLFNDYKLKYIWLRHFNLGPLEFLFRCIRIHGYRHT